MVASNGEEAVAANIKHSPDIVFLDINKPVMDGVEACKVIKRDTPTTPLVCITANVSKEDIRAYTSHGYDYHVGKPVDLVALYKILRSLNP
ncbi:MAG: response regulator [Glaciecola sp.]